MLSAKEIMEHAQDTTIVSEKKRFGFNEAKHIGDALGIRWDKFDVEQFAMGFNIELERSLRGRATDLTRDELMATGGIVLARLNEIPDYYTQLVVVICSSLRAFDSFRLLLL